MPYRVQELIQDRPLPVCVVPEATAQEAIGLMLASDFSQLPIVDAGGTIHGIVTTDSILRALNEFPTAIDRLEVLHARVRVPQLSCDDDLADLLEAIAGHRAVLIVNTDNRLVAIVTSYDTTSYFRDRAEDWMSVYDIEAEIREHISAAFSDHSGKPKREELQAAIARITSSQPAYARRPPQSLEDLSLNDYIQLLLLESKTDYVEAVFRLDSKLIRRLLDRVRKIRNRLAHPDEGEIIPVLEPEERDQLSFCANWLSGLRHRRPQLRPEVSLKPDERSIPGSKAGALAPAFELEAPTESRYASLARYLRAQSSRADTLTLTFAEIEALVGSLPPLARRHRSWWANDSRTRVQSIQWLDAGWRVDSVDIAAESVVFTRDPARSRAYAEFFNGLRERLKDATVDESESASVEGLPWLLVKALPSEPPHLAGVFATFALGNRFRVELYIDTGDQERNQRVFDALHSRSEEIERQVGEKLCWETMDKHAAARVALYHTGSITDPPEDLVSLRDWTAIKVQCFYNAVLPLASEILTK